MSPPPPARPRLSRGLAVVPFDDRLLLEGGPSRRLLTGAAATAVVPKLLPLLDGRHTIEQVAERAGLTTAQAAQAVALLDLSGLVERVDGEAGERLDVPESTTTFLSRAVGVTRAHRGSERLLATLAGSAALVVAPPAVAAQIEPDLRASGVGRVAVAGGGPVGEADAAWLAASPGQLMIVMDQPGREGELPRLEALCRARGVPLLRFAGGPDRLEVGPLFTADTACADCYREAAEGAEEAEAADRPLASASSTGVPAADQLAAGMVVAEALAVLAQLTAPATFRSVTRISLPGLLAERRWLTPRAGCAGCGAWPAQQDGTTELARTYEWLLEAPPAALRVAGGGAAEAAAEAAGEAGPNPAGSPLADEFATSPRGRLPERSAPVAEILERLVAERDPAAARRHPLGGQGAASVEIYLLADPLRLTDLPGTVFRYDPATGEVISARADPLPLDRCLDGTGLPGERLVAALVLVGAIGQVTFERLGLWYRLAHLSGGRAAALLAAAAGDRGLEVAIAARWSEELAELLELRQRREVVTAVAGLYQKEGADAAAR